MKKVLILQQFWKYERGRDYVATIGYGIWKDIPVEHENVPLD